MSDKKSETGLGAFQKAWEAFAEKTSPVTLDWSRQFTKLRGQFVQISQNIERDLPQMQATEDIEIDGGEIDGEVGRIGARIYTPHSARHPVGPSLVFFHGGGFVLGDLGTADSTCRRLADLSGCRILSVDYRLAPEFKFPSQINDAVAAYNWAVSHAAEWGADPDLIAVGGDSAGGNLAINVTRAAQEGLCPMPVYQLLIYPLTQFVDLKTKGVKFQEGSFFSPAVFDFCKTAYLDEGQDVMDLRVSPLFHSDFRGLPPAHVITAGWDPLHDEGQVYAEKLRAAGVRTTMENFADLPHGFFNFTPVSKPARDAVEATGHILAEALGRL
ncbi:alpha/beta hydrolase [Hirschia litorea]|uniref:Alpha/beta hydrolase n=1 Tax=Hirschia litorea TaxID=1199156 RepID=A0ABW2IMI8_9PROT